ncbi:orotidine 5'-phosphate decarboxylase [Apophysomyces sp. BC1034]|nr:orotidine 5'-phosphate decarboxylase [Apophysomyces sp. BC1015]KAG0175820.1 orotidine 5'-phosphate decarboxylase [Apophysomyces sp. BC1021]KAG0185838.1 orotidine 5'-phosphate decarboxylase [Apophysomyces sp. BC1034]
MLNTYKSYAERAQQHPNACARSLFELMERKQTNLSVAVDVTTKKELLAIADMVGPFVCVLKTHIDIVEDFDRDLVEQLEHLAKKHDFLIFEDRKFADIGNTVKHQYEQGIYKIASWSHITNAHTVPGEGIVKGLAEVGLPLGRGLLLLAEMSSKGALTKGDYTVESVEMARRNKDFVFGFIAQHKMNEHPDEDFVVMAPGVGLDVTGDGLGQQYRTPHQVIVESGCDIIIVGRGIYGKPDEVEQQAQRYREAGWNAYLERVRQHSQ